MQGIGLSLPACPILVDGLQRCALSTVNFPFKRNHHGGFSKCVEVGDFIDKRIFQDRMTSITSLTVSVFQRFIRN